MTSPSSQAPLPASSALSAFIESASVEKPTDALPLQVLHNLGYQHNWTALRVHPSASSVIQDDAFKNLGDEDTISFPANPVESDDIRSRPVTILSGYPPRPVYTHPDYQAHLLAHDLIDARSLSQQEWVLPMSIGEKWTLHRFCAVFDSLPERQLLQGAGTYKHQDSKRLLLAMVGHQGKGGDGTVVYYIMQEGDVKPRQN